MSFFSRLGLLTAVAGAGVYYYARKRSEQTGRDIGAVMSNLPEELKQTKSDLEQRFRTAVSAGKEAAHEKEAEIEHQLEATEEPPPISPVVPGDYIV